MAAAYINHVDISDDFIPNLHFYRKIIFTEEKKKDIFPISTVDVYPYGLL